MVVNTGLTEKGLKNEFFERFDKTPQYYLDLATRIQSTTDHETYRFLGSSPAMREWGTGRLARGLRTESYSVKNAKYESTIEVDRDELSDDQTGQIKVRVNEMAIAAAAHKDFLIGDLLINGAVAGYNSYDGVTFFSAAHESGESGAMDNTLTSTAAVPATPDIFEFITAIQLGIGRMLSFKDDQGNPSIFSIGAGNFALILPPQLYFTALQAVTATMTGATTSNPVQGIAKAIPFGWLSAAPTVFYVAYTGGHIRPFIFQDREPIEFTALEDKSDEGFRREHYLYGVRARYKMTYGEHRYCVRVTLTEP